MALDLNKVKAMLLITDNSMDNTLKTYMPIVEDFIKTYCNDDFENGLPPALQLIAAKMINYHLNIPTGVTSKTIGDVSESYTEDYPAEVYKVLKLHKKAKFV